jgi:NAD(P)-dependent dehydrogenase (short-subunit alcohol dehydrogenase family)
LAKTIVVTGAASGIGRATTQLLRDRGHGVIGIDLRNTDVEADLSSDEGRKAMVDGVRERVGGNIDGFVAAAGVSPDQGDAEAILRINYYGAVATAEGLRPLLDPGKPARGVMISSTSTLMAPDQEWARKLMGGDEHAVVAELGNDPATAYMSSKLAISLWTRKSAVAQEWAGSGNLLNCIVPGVIDTPMNSKLFEREDGPKMLAQAQPNALGRYGRPEEVAEAIAFLVADSPAYLVGQLLYVDGGTDAILRPMAY